MGEHIASRTIVVAGLGMVALSFIEKVREYDEHEDYNIRVFSEEPHG
jgi:nitrite reductase (NAD(P)H)